MSIEGFVLPPRITLEEATRNAQGPLGTLKRKALAESDRPTKKGTAFGWCTRGRV